ncbi:PAS domain S-box protein [Idiomarina xiamenensis]|uniref:Sensor protein FixL n=1 Tax=Idiomarina xiamenensis 10-D-4 TaxID=740709 RepID=K2JVY1_9GAMM|nr:PAS domain S-box protein [Idiomarina xiamenensis]EKE87561.1 Two-component hybrid sensor and regulator [Idiomarina xiamenensis 10-D-4]
MQTDNHKEIIRLAALDKTGLLDTPPEERFERYTRMAQKIFSVPIVTISLVAKERQWFKSVIGLDFCETPRNVSICSFAITVEDLLVVNDLSADERFKELPAVTGEPHLRAYAGAPVQSADGLRLGTLCVIDTQVREFNETQLALLRELAACVEAELQRVNESQQQWELHQAKRLNDVIARAQSKFIQASNRTAAFDGLLHDVLALTDSEYGFIGDILYDEHGQPYMKAYTLTNIAWDKASREFFDKHAPTGLEFRDMTTLFGRAVTAGKPLISDSPMTDSRAKGLPPGHPELRKFMAIPAYYGGEIVALVGVANAVSGYREEQVSFLEPLTSTIAQLVYASRVREEKEAAQQLLNESEQRFRSLAESAPVGIFEIDDNNRCLFVNDRALWLANLTREQAMAGEWLTAVEPEDRSELLERWQCYQQSGSSFRFDFRFRRSQQDLPSNAWVTCQVSPLRDQQQRIVGHIGTLMDITEQKQSEQQLRNAYALIEKTSEAAKMGTWEVDLIDNSLHWSAMTKRIHEVDDDYQPTLDSAFAFYRDDGSLQRLQQAVDEAIEHFKAYDLELVITTASGRSRWVRSIGLPRIENGRCAGLQGLFQDISARKESELQLREQASYTEAILDNMLDGIITINQRGIMVTANQSVEQLFGYQREQLIGNNVKMLMPSPHQEHHDEYLSNYQQTGIARIIGIGREVEGMRQDGSLFPMELSVWEVEHAGQPHYVGMIRDITERKRLETMKSEFISTVSHELRTPLTSISGALGLINGGIAGTLPESASRMIEIAYKNSQRLTYLINDLLDMEKLVAGKMVFDIKLQPLWPQLQYAVESHQTFAGERSVKVSLETTEDHTFVRIDNQRFQQVLANLLSNAIKFSPDGGIVDVSLSHRKGFVRVSVSDHGPGIPLAFHQQIFTKFSQADASDTRKKGGTGLGLAITRELVERMGGRINFESVEGEGATFYVDLPAFQEHSSVADEKLSQHQVVDNALTGKKRVLILEDDPDIAQLLALTIGRGGYATEIAFSQQQALQLVATQQFAAITVDLLLPDGNGVDFIHAVRKQPKLRDLPLIVLSVKMEEGRLAINGRYAGIDWLSKPIDEKRLLQALQRATLTSSEHSLPLLLVCKDENTAASITSSNNCQQDWHHVTSLIAMKDYLATQRVDTVFIDINMLSDDANGRQAVQQLATNTRVVMLTAEQLNQGDAAVKALLKTQQLAPSELLALIDDELNRQATLTKTTPDSDKD